MANIEELKKYNHIHMIGIGGISMSGIAEILNFWGFKVTGSDTTKSEVTDKLLSQGIPVVIGHDLENVAKADLVVYSAAVKDNDPELSKARSLNIPIITRGTFLGQITRAFSNSICVSGTHGKTTTTSMISVCFLEAHKDPSIQVGAFLKQIDGNYRVGASEYFIIEACEYVESYLKLFPKTEVILNIDNDHLDYFKNIDNIVTSFKKYVKLLPADGLLVINGDDFRCKEVARECKARVITFGIDNDHANYIARNIKFDKNGFSSFDVYYNNFFWGTVKLSIPGIHNVLNALSCIAVCNYYGLERDEIKDALYKYTGAHRRFEYVGTYKGVNIYDDYGHHPTEISATASALKQKQYRQSWVIFQPHTYSRTKNLLGDFARSLLSFDNIIVTDIYAAREDNTFNISSKDLIKEIEKLGKKAIYISDFPDIVTYIRERAMPNDIVLTLGAGTVTNIGPMILEQ